MVNYQLAKRRSGNHKTKQIGEISGTGKKPYSQKGTGNARQGLAAFPAVPQEARSFSDRSCAITPTACRRTSASSR